MQKHLEQATRNWSWLDTATGLALGFLLGWYLGAGLPFDELKPYLLQLLQAWLAMFFWSRCWEAARAPRAYSKIDWQKMSVMQIVALTVKENFVALFAGVSGLACTLALTPSVTALLTAVGAK